MVEVDHVATNVTWRRLLAEKKTAAGDTMGEGEGGDNDGSVFVDGLWNLAVDFVKENLVRRIGTKIIDLWLEDALEVLRPIDMEILGAPEKSEGREHADEPEGVVAVEVGEENGLEMGEADVGTTQRHLCTFCAVEHEELFADVDNLRGTESARGGESGPTSKYINFELFHERFLEFFGGWMSLTEREKVAESTMLLVSTLGEDTMGIALFVWGEDFLDLLRKKGIVGIAILCFVIGNLFFFVVLRGGELDNARVIASIVFSAIH